VVGIGHQEGQRIAEYGGGFVELDAMLLGISDRFCRIPFECVGHWPPHQSQALFEPALAPVAG
jgi:hypothetical protein